MKLRTPPAELAAKLTSHKHWLATEGRCGGRARLKFEDLSDLDLANVDLQGADLSDTIFNRTNLTDANLYRAVLHNACLSGAKLHGTNFELADMTGANLRDAHGVLFHKMEDIQYDHDLYIHDGRLRGIRVICGNNSLSVASITGIWKQRSDERWREIMLPALQKLLQEAVTLWTADRSIWQSASDALVVFNKLVEATPNGGGIKRQRVEKPISARLG